MSKTHYLLQHLRDLPLRRIGADEDAGLCIASLPWPRAVYTPRSLGARPTYVRQLGQWPREAEGSPRRLLMIADAGSQAPASLHITPQDATASVAPVTPQADAELFERCTELAMMWERHLLRISWGGRSVGFAMGLRHAGEVHWWECCRMVVLEETPTCRVVEMGGAIPRKLFGDKELKQYTGHDNPFIHHHNWINGHIYARLHSNGVCEIFAHHINSKFFDDGETLHDVVPVIGIAPDRPAAAFASASNPPQKWTGEITSLNLAGVRLDLTEVARLATPQAPGSLESDGRFLILQPYEGVELFSGGYAQETKGDPYLCRAAEHVFPRGMARTLRFSFSLNPHRSPRVARYAAPSWWYGMCEEFSPEPLLPVSNEYDIKLESARKYVDTYIVKGGFEEGSVPRSVGDHKAINGRFEAGWEGEGPYSQFLSAWRTGQKQDFDHALRAAYFFTDVCIDHAAKLVRMHGYPPHAISIPMTRVQGTLAAWLETGDSYLLDAAMAVVDHAHWTQKNSWPRLAVGRDAKYVRSAALLYRYLGDEHYRKLACDGALMAAQSQRANGSFGDQAGGTGIHQRAAYVTKPWMGMMCTEGILDFLELCGEEPRLTHAIERWADWLMKNRFRHQNGVTGWSYQHDFNGQTRHFRVQTGEWSDLPSPGIWHLDSLARVLAFCAFRGGDMSFIDAWAESYHHDPRVGSDHSLAATGQHLPWIQAKLWNATLTEEGITIRPVHFGPRTPRHAQILTPRGPVAVEWDAHGNVIAPPGVVIETEPATM